MMSKNLKIFLGTIILSMPFWVGVNLLSAKTEQFFLWNALAKNNQASAISQLENLVQKERPIKKSGVPDLVLDAEAGFSLFINETGNAKVLFSKNADTPFPIASITKLMTAYVVAKNFDLTKEITITREAVAEEESFGLLGAGNIFFVKDLLYPLLMESSNDAAAAFAIQIGKGAFVHLINKEAETLELTGSHFVNYAGLDPDYPSTAINLSTAKDISSLARDLKEHYPDIFSILGTKELSLYDSKGWFHHDMKNTNELLFYENWPTKVLAGKTGWTPEAKGALMLALEGPKEKGYVINVVLRAPDRFFDMKELIDWVYQSYNW